MNHYTQDNIQQHFALSDEAFEGLIIYHKLLIKWQKAINLVSNKTLQEVWHRHFADSVQLAQLMPEKGVYADLGCGAGFPGLVIAMMRPELDVHLVESDERKGQFMRTVIREAGVKNATVHAARIEDMTAVLAPDFVSARALASLRELLDYCQPWINVNPDLRFYFLKGAQAVDEIEEARKAYDFIVQTSPSATEEQAQILLLEKVALRH